MKIDKKTIRWVASLANLSLNKEEEQEMQKQLLAILEYMDILSELDLEGVEPTAHTLGYTNVTRKDRVGESFGVEDVKAMAPKWERGHIVVPRVV
jgi:aspartyl-tRNA(Asn)/glutamyl-tRNA(Gln) amidotransferase subunit C